MLSRNCPAMLDSEPHFESQMVIASFQQHISTSALVKLSQQSLVERIVGQPSLSHALRRLSISRATAPSTLPWIKSGHIVIRRSTVLWAQWFVRERLSNLTSTNLVLTRFTWWRGIDRRSSGERLFQGFMFLYGYTSLKRTSISTSLNIYRPRSLGQTGTPCQHLSIHFRLTKIWGDLPKPFGLFDSMNKTLGKRVIIETSTTPSMSLSAYPPWGEGLPFSQAEWLRKHKLQYLSAVQVAQKTCLGKCTVLVFIPKLSFGRQRWLNSVICIGRVLI
jgi:hypothetical protein